MTLLIGLVLLVAVFTAAIAYGAVRNKAAFQQQNEIVRGTPSRAPAAWAGAHSPEAKLHRRLRAVVDAARAQAGADGSGFGDVQQAVERGALEIDDRLIVAAALPAGHREAAIAAIEPSVIALENAVAGAGSAAAPGITGGAPAAIDAAVVEVQSRLDAIAEARAEVDLLDTAQPRHTSPVPPDVPRPMTDIAQTRPAEGGTGTT